MKTLELIAGAVLCTVLQVGEARASCESHRMTAVSSSPELLKNTESFLWEVTSQTGARSFIFGVTHAIPQKEVGFWDPLISLISGSRVYLPEMPLDTSSLAGFGNVKVREHSLGATTQKKTWAIYSALGQSVQRDFVGLDQILFSAATAFRIATVPLQSIVDLELTFDQFSDAFHEDVLKDTECNLEAVREQGAKMIRAFVQRDPKQLVKAAFELKSFGNSRSTDFNQRLLYDRNLIFVKKLIPELERGGVFSVFGALHLFGPNGVLEKLRVAGFTVAPLDMTLQRRRFLDLTPANHLVELRKSAVDAREFIASTSDRLSSSIRTVDVPSFRLRSKGDVAGAVPDITFDGAEYQVTPEFVSAIKSGDLVAQGKLVHETVHWAQSVTNGRLTPTCSDAWEEHERESALIERQFLMRRGRNIGLSREHYLAVCKP